MLAKMSRFERGIRWLLAWIGILYAVTFYFTLQWQVQEDDSLSLQIQIPAPTKPIVITSRRNHSVRIPVYSPRTSLVKPAEMEKLLVRNDTTKWIAQQCVRTGQGGIYLKHFRKAGGSSISRMMKAVSCAPPNIPTFTSEFPYFNPQSFQELGTSIFLTVLRDPIDRILSMYWFEGRWPRVCGMDCEAKRVKDDSTKVADLGDWVESVYAQTNHVHLGYVRHSQCGQWISVNNYYTRLLLGVDRAEDREAASTPFHRGYKNVTLTREHLELAKKILSNFDLILIQEEMTKPSNMTRMFTEILGMQRPKTTVGRARHGQEREKYFVPPTTAERQRLQELNAFDMELYEYAKELSAKAVEDYFDFSRDRKRFNASVCSMPDRLLPPEKHEIVLGGLGCKKTPWFYYPGDCMLHSREASSK